MKKNLLILLFGFLFGLPSTGQTSSFTGTFLNSTNTVTLQFKQVDDEYHGMLTTAGTSFAIRASKSENQLTGKVFGLNGPLDFAATLNGTNIKVTTLGYSENYSKYSDLNNIAYFDLTPYMVDYSNPNNSLNTQPNNFPNPEGNTDNSQSYSQGPDFKTEEYKEYPNNSGNRGNSSPYPALNNQEVLDIISGSQLVYYQRTSYLNNNTASSMTYVNFCTNGTFSISTDASFSVEGDYGGNAHGASRSDRTGTWKLVSYQGQPAVYMQYYNGQSNLNPFDINNIRQGRWRIGNTQYALQQNGARCN